MAGIYLHIPFCKQACIYCDFHFSTNLSRQQRMVDALSSELKNRTAEITENVETIYFGGGTPSLLTQEQLGHLIRIIRSNYEVDPNAEVTLEANPDDISDEVLQGWKDASVNRLSIGVQSFDEDVLSWMNRAHNAVEARQSVQLARLRGFDNITIDLIYGIPGRTDQYWQEQVNKAMELGVDHISAYCLTREPKTVLDKHVHQGKVSMPSDDSAGTEFETLVNALRSAGYQQYEVSNFAKPGKESRHNSSYWKGKTYLGVGPSAHSYNRVSRRWNIANNASYLKAIEEEQPYHETEELTQTDRYNEYVLTRLRTKWGVDLGDLKDIRADLAIHFINEVEDYLEFFDPDVSESYRLNHQGMLLADRIASDLFIVD